MSFFFTCGCAFSHAGLSSWTAPFPLPSLAPQTRLCHATTCLWHAGRGLVRPPYTGVAGGPHITSSGPPGDAGPPVQGVAGESGSKGPLRPSGSTQPGLVFSIIKPVARYGRRAHLWRSSLGRRRRPRRSDAASVFDEDGVVEPLAASSASVEIPDDAVVAKWTSLAPLAAPSSSAWWSPLQPPLSPLLVGWKVVERLDFRLFFVGISAASRFSKLFLSSEASSDSSPSLPHLERLSILAVLAAVSSSSAWDSAWCLSLSCIMVDDSEALRKPFRDGLSSHAAPLVDAASILASSFSRGVSALCRGVVAVSPASVRPLLESLPLTDGFFFSYPRQDLSSAMLLQMSARLALASAASRRLPPAFLRRVSARAAAPSRPCLLLPPSVPPSPARADRLKAVYRFRNRLFIDCLCFRLDSVKASLFFCVPGIERRPSASWSPFSPPSPHRFAASFVSLVASSPGVWRRFSPPPPHRRFLAASSLSRHCLRRLSGASVGLFVAHSLPTLSVVSAWRPLVFASPS